MIVHTFDPNSIAGATSSRVFQLDAGLVVTTRFLFIGAVLSQYLQVEKINLYGVDPLAIV